MATFGVSQDIVPGNLTVAGAFLLSSVVDGITAKAGGGQNPLTPIGQPVPASTITTQFTRVTTVATVADSITLGPSLLGDDLAVFNAGANSMNVFPTVGEAIGTGSANAAFAVPAGKGCYLFCVTPGRWLPVLSA